MSIVRVKERAPGSFFIADKQYLWEFKMKMSARGLLTVLVGLPDDWIVSVSWFAKNYVEGRDAFHTMFRELQKFGYIEKKEYRNKRGEIRSVDYIVYERADLNRAFDPSAEKPYPVDARIIKNNYYQDNNCSSESENENNEAQLDLFAEGNEEETVAVIAEPVEPKVSEPVVADKLDEIKSLFSGKTELFPCHDAIPKQSSMLKHCLKAVRQVETVIGAVLTPAQEEVVTDVANYFSVKGAESELASWITEALLSRYIFDRCKTFVHKMNAIVSKLRIGAFTKPRRFDFSVKRKWPAKNALSAAHEVVAARMDKSGIEIKSLETEIRNVNSQLSTSMSAVEQFRNFPKIARMHEKCVETYREQLNNLRSKLNALKNSSVDYTDKAAFIPCVQPINSTGEYYV